MLKHEIYCLFGIPFHISHEFRLAGKRYRVNPEGVETLKLFLDLYKQCRSDSNGGWAIRARALIREIERLDSTHTLTLVAMRAQNPTIRNLAIWLRGRCGGRIGSSTIATFASDPNFSTRKEVVRALKCMADWPTLQLMAENDTSERIRRLATCDPARPIAQRVANYSRHVTPSRIHPLSPRRLFIRPGVDLRERTPPRSAIWLRFILRRIARLVGRPA